MTTFFMCLFIGLIYREGLCIKVHRRRIQYLSELCYGGGLVSFFASNFFCNLHNLKNKYNFSFQLAI